MLTPELLYRMLENVLREARIKWKEAWVIRIKIATRKIIVFMKIGPEQYNVKAIIYRDHVKVRVYSRLKGLEISLQKIFEREYEKVLKMRERERLEESL